MKKIVLATVALSALLLTGCGGSGGSSNPIDSKNYVIVLTDVHEGICESQQYRDRLASGGVVGAITEETEDASCDTYGKKNDGYECAMESVGGGTKRCTIGFDNRTGSLERKATGTSSNILDAAEILSATFE
jgi:hypothetical protein